MLIATIGTLCFLQHYGHIKQHKMTTQFTPFELVYGIQPIMQTKFMVLIKRIMDLPIEGINKAIHVRMEDLIRLDEERWRVGENINHI
jgi:hypothetical protein